MELLIADLNVASFKSIANSKGHTLMIARSMMRLQSLSGTRDWERERSMMRLQSLNGTRDLSLSLLQSLDGTRDCRIQ